ncbi:MAG: 16S rRNA (guanine(527)-N(7))-methyltransferase RsmG [Muribaculaceae bacterium]|nr:16S rRNA (guanine(527)-N(7))-methyltransferase RsmG [Muribaculaceae bacterium]
MQTIKSYFPALTPLQTEQFEKLGVLYPEWNDKINVISRKDIQNLYINHILHSLSIIKFIEFKDNSKVLDMGSGGGFPGIPLAIMFPNVSFLLVDRIGKKLKVAQDIANQLGLTNVSIQHGDIKEVKGRFDFIVSRAVMRLDELVPLVRNLVSKESVHSIPNGLICLKGGELSDEICSVKFPVLETDLKTYFKEDFFKTKKIIYVQL